MQNYIVPVMQLPFLIWYYNAIAFFFYRFLDFFPFFRPNVWDYGDIENSNYYAKKETIFVGQQLGQSH